MNSLAIVTGGTRGIGREITISLIEQGYDVFFTFQHSHSMAQELEERYSGKCRGFLVDSMDWQGIQKFSIDVLKDRVPTVLVNNVGINCDELFVNQAIDTFWSTLQLNFGSMLCFCKSFVSSMLEQRRGHIINISSVSAIKPKVGNSAYGVAKAAIERFSKSLALEVARFNVYVNCVSPAYVQTDLLSEFLKSKNQSDFYKSIPMRKVLMPKEIAELVANLCSGKIKTTGSVFYIGHGENIVG